MLAGFLGLVILTVILFPATPLGRSLHRGFVEWPLELAARMERKHVILLAIILFAGPSMAVLGADLALVYAVDLSIYADAVVATTIAASAARMKSLWWRSKDKAARLATFIRKPRQRAARSRARTSRARNSPGNDDDPAAVWVACAA